MKTGNLIFWLAAGTISVTNYCGDVVSGTFVRANRSHVFIRNADGVVRAMPYSALPPQDRARAREMAERHSAGAVQGSLPQERVRAMAEPPAAPVPATSSKGETR